jgi:electron transfer flavoprotein alpha subunit
MNEEPQILISDSCNGCGLCLEVCPYNSIKFKDKKAIINEDCQFCRACIDVCPEGAINIFVIEQKLDNFENKGIFVFAEHQRGENHPVAYELLEKGKELAGVLNESLFAVILGNHLEDAAKELTYRGAERVYVYDDQTLEDFRIDPYTELLVSLFKELNPSIILIGATSIGRSLAPRVAARLQTGLTADCTELSIEPENGLLLQTRPAFGGNIMAEIITPKSKPQMATVRYKVMREAERDETNRGEIINREVEASRLPDRVKIINYETARDKVNIIDADIIVSGGKGLGDPEGFKLMEALANTLHGAVGASRPTVDEGWINYRHQVGLSGRTVKPQIYLACGISGAVQHLAGMRTSDMIISINKDKDAPIFNVSSLGVVGDLYEVIPLLIKKSKQYEAN